MLAVCELPEPFFLPRIGAVAVAVDFPKTRFILCEEFEATYPLGSLPCVTLRSEDPHRSAVFGLERLAVHRVYKHRVFIGHPLEREVRRVTSVRVLENKLRFRFHFDGLDEIPEHDAFPFIVKPAPVCNTVEVGPEFRLGQFHEIVPRPIPGLDHAPHLEFPFLG